jgi:chaperonin cofactor prefoldin
MSTVEQLQVVVSEVQNARHQVATVRAQLQELETTISAVEKHPEGMALHRQLGGVLVEVDNKAELVEELKTTYSTLAEHAERLSEHEAKLVAAYEELKKSLEGEA